MQLNFDDTVGFDSRTYQISVWRTDSCSVGLYVWKRTHDAGEIPSEGKRLF